RRLLEEMAEIILRVIPAVALVLDIGLQQRERITGFAAGVFERAGNRNDVLEMRDVGQKASDLRLGIDAGPQPAVDLQEPVIAENDRRVGGARTERAQLERIEIGLRELRVGSRRLEAQCACRRGKLAASAACAD